MIRIIANSIKLAIEHEKNIKLITNVFKKDTKIKIHRIKVTENDVNLIMLCHKYGLKNENDFKKLIKD